jgi:polyhydroxyalkanoate synthesis regulator phasin
MAVTIWEDAPLMAPRRPTTPPLADAVRDAVQATLGQAREAQEETGRRAKDARTRAQNAVDELVRGAEQSASQVRERVTQAIDEARPATHDDIKAIQKELRAIGRRLDAIEERLPQPRRSAAPKKKA